MDRVGRPCRGEIGTAIAERRRDARHVRRRAAEGGADLIRLMQQCVAAQDLRPGPERRWVIDLIAAADQHVHFAPDPEARDLRHQPRLAGAGLAGDQQQRAALGEGVVERRRDRRQLVGTPDAAGDRRCRDARRLVPTLGDVRFDAPALGAHLGRDRADEAIAVTGEGADHRGRALAIADRGARATDAGMHRCLGDRAVAPHGGAQLVMPDDAMALAYELEQQVEDLRADAYDLAGAAELAARFVELAGAEAMDGRARHRSQPPAACSTSATRPGMRSACAVAAAVPSSAAARRREAPVSLAISIRAYANCACATVPGEPMRSLSTSARSKCSVANFQRRMTPARAPRNPSTAPKNPNAKPLITNVPANGRSFS